MPNATCFLIAYLLVLVIESVRFVISGESLRQWLTRVSLGMFLLAFLTHTLYLADLVIQGIWYEQGFRYLKTWGDWSIAAAWVLALAYCVMLYRRSDKQIGLFLLPLILLLVALAVVFPSDSPIGKSTSTVSFWRMVHSMAMLIGTILVALGFASGVMYFVHARKLKSRLNRRWSFRLPSLEYLQKLGQSCTLGSAAAIGFGVVSGAIMNFTRDGFVAWTDRGILLTTALFVWLCIAALAQKISSNRGKGEWTAALNILSFAIVVATLAAVVTAPHGVSTWGDA
ncbi:MAG: cytochrome c biogenesis protein CcsA [Pirellula sp.]|nr:cytochrome c biogenesis protein CcsA [Pirellula sp.]